MNAETIKKKTSTFTVKSGETIMSSCNTTDVYSESKLKCGAMCVLHDACCVASFSKESSICRLDITERCCVATNPAIGWSVMTRNQYRKLVEMETSMENEFIKNEVKTRNTGVKGYWIGGYNFNQDDDMEWLSKPNQVMPFSDMAPGDPNRPMDQLCMGMWRMDGEEEWSDWSDTDLLKIHNYYELNGGQFTGEPQHNSSASQNQHTKSPVNGDNESNHCISEESESRPSNISSDQSSDTIRDRPSQHDDITRNGRNETNASCSNTSEVELSSTLTEQSSAASNTTTDICGGNQDENMHNG
ncbi:unnamed protein product [Mytilus edulis]|uniref:C-type lectin domain-containing protein n=1 Tax=Mytilus edulis TaxID=6550 RepID=A0A8S3QV44_MYTED|nr:unnamed protein product [Mytilus edulis]